MNVVGFAGYSGSGKTTLVEKLIPALRLRGLRVSVVKHVHHRFDIDQPGQLPEATLRPVLDLNNADAVAYFLVNNQDRFHYSFEDRPG
jgi:Ni2+-binding GTPase involved in maturation of urease and hydrogenase